MTELYQMKNELTPPTMDSILNNKRNVTYNFRNLQGSTQKERDLFLMV